MRILETLVALKTTFPNVLHSSKSFPLFSIHELLISMGSTSYDLCSVGCEGEGLMRYKGLNKTM